MNTVSKIHVLQKLERQAINSNHYIWLLSELDYFETKNGFLFAYGKSGRTTFVALEPLVDNQNDSVQELEQAIDELTQFLNTKTIAFIGIYQAFKDQLARIGFQSICVGRDPWVLLKDSAPKGNKGKGIRNARNSAIKSGVTIEEWSLQSFRDNDFQRQQIEKLYHIWSQSSPFQMSGFLLTTDPFANIDGRRLFVAKNSNEVCGLLLATPVQQGRSFYFEDLIFSPAAPNGTTELLTLHAMAALNAEGYVEVSLGVVALNNMEFGEEVQVSWFAQLTLRCAKIIAQQFYNSEGIELYRKRFQPYRWENVYVSCRNHLWLEVLVSSVALFRPRLNLSVSLLQTFIKDFVRKNSFGLVWLFMLLSISAYPTSYMAFLFNFLAGIKFISTLELLIRRKALIACMTVGYTLDQFFNHSVLLTGSWSSYRGWFGVTLLSIFLGGLYVNQMRLRREQTFLILTLVLLLLLPFTILKPDHVYPALLPTLMFFAGYLCGKVYFERDRALSRRHAKGKSQTMTVPAANPQTQRNVKKT